MRLLVDEDVDVRVIAALKRLGHDVRRVPSGIANGDVMRLSKRQRRVLITRDSDFANTALHPPSQSAGIIHLAIHPPRLARLVPPLMRLLRSMPASAFPGSLFVLESHGYRQVP